MKSVQRIVVTWLATAYGGAEKSSFELCRTIRRRYQIEVTLIIWHYGEVFDFAAEDDLTQGVGGTHTVMHCHSADEYRRCVHAVLAVEGLPAMLISNHRTYQVDLHLAERRRVLCAVVFRQTPMAGEALRTLPSDTSSELVYMRGDELDWGLLGSAGALIGVSDFGARGIALFAKPDTNIVRIYNGLHMPGAPAAITPRAVRRFLIVSRLIGWKAIDFGIEAFAHLCARYPQVRLQIAGNGEEETGLRHLSEQLQIGTQVEFLGFVHDIRKVYADNDCLLHLSGIESFGRVVIEAALCGLPVVVPRSAGTGELVINEHTGLTFDPDDMSDCIRAMECAYHLSIADYLRLGSAAQQRAVAVFNPDRVAEDYIALANSLIS